MSNTLDQWTVDLSLAVASALGEFQPRIQEQIAVFAVDTHPWNGILVLALLIQAELESDPELSKSAEMAAWKHYDFAAALEAWKPATRLGSIMRQEYEKASENRFLVADSYLTATAKAVKSKVVNARLSMYKLSPFFRITIPHPDSDKEFYLA